MEGSVFRMNIEYGKSLQLGSKFYNDLLNSNTAMVINGAGFNWRGIFNSNESYNVNDVVIRFDSNGSPKLLRATLESSGPYRSGNWEEFNFPFANADRLDNADKLLSTLIYALTGAENYKGKYDPSETYAKGDVVTAVIEGKVFIVRAEADTITQGKFNSEEWSILRLLSENEVRSLSSGNNSTPIYDIIINKYGWKDIPAEENISGYKKKYEMNISFIKKEHFPHITYHFEDIDTVNDIHMAPSIKVEDGKITFYAVDEPVTDINATMVIVNVVNGASSTITPTTTISISNNASKWVTYDNTHPDYGYEVYNTDGEKCTLAYEAAIPEIKSNYYPIITFAVSSLTTVEVAKMASIVLVKDGSIIFFATEVPKSNIMAEVAFSNVIGSEELTTLPTYNIDIPKTGWYYNYDIPGYIRRFDYYDENVREDMNILIGYNISRLRYLHDMELCPLVKIGNGIIQFYSNKVPTINITAKLILLNTLIGVTGSNVGGSSSSSTTIINDLIDHVATDEEVMAIIRQTLGI